MTQKVDVVFVLDETASMTDNIRGIRAYVDFLFEAFDREGRDATFGLVTFRDETRTYGRTDDLGTFKNWLFKIGVDGGGDIAEAGLDGLMTAVTETQFRKDAQRFIVLASDGAFHDADYDGKSAYSLDQVIETLQNAHVRVDVIGIDYLPIRQIALATGGTWRAIPGRGYLEYVPPLTLTVKLFSKLGTLNLENGQMDDKITVYINNPPRPKQLTLTWKVLNPLGERCYGPFTERKMIPDDGSTQVELRPELNSEVFQTIPGIYTIIYRLENEQGHQSILRRTLTF
ncbi:VWA domain-containing protein [Candidatus Poribacteria bacterium]|nr:VWA domain-containing protein [Candidatus Poribacteria bacterium]